MYFRSNKKNNNNVSLNDSIGYDKDGNEINLIDVIKSNNTELTEFLHNKDNLDKLNKYLSVLNEREKEIIIKDTVFLIMMNLLKKKYQNI